MSSKINFETNPKIYKHWELNIQENRAFLIMKVDEDAGFFEGYKLKLNSYDIGVDIELADAVQRLRFEHPQINSIIIKSGNEKAFCAGANIKMLASSDHAHKVNFCKFTNETRNFLENSSKESSQLFLCLVEGVCAGGGYELALACDHIILLDDGSSSISLPEVPLLAVLPGTGGLTRLTDKRKIRRDLADVFCTMEEGVKAKKAKDWRLVDTITKKTSLNDELNLLIKEKSSNKKQADNLVGIKLKNIQKNNVNNENVIYGSSSRLKSLHVALENIFQNNLQTKYTLIHDVARPILNIDDIKKLIASMKTDIDASTLGYPLTNALKDVKNNKILNNLYKDKLWSSFTPQIFKTKKLYESILKIISNGYHIDDDIEAMMINDFNCSIVRSSPDNIKVTFLEDIEVIKRLL